MDTTPADAFARIEALARETFEQVESSADHTPERAILRLRAVYGVYQVLVTELLSAIRLKYGHIGAEHAGEPVPHLHRADKTQLSLTDEMTFEAFPRTWPIGPSSS